MTQRDMTETVPATYHLQEVTKLEAEIKRLTVENWQLRGAQVMTESEGWRCNKCGGHFFLHALKDGKPVCPPADIDGERMPECPHCGKISEDRTHAPGCSRAHDETEPKR